MARQYPIIIGSRDAVCRIPRFLLASAVRALLFWRRFVRVSHSSSRGFCAGFAQTSRPASGRARFTARGGIGGSITKSTVQTEFAADAARAVCRRQTAPDAGLRRCLIPAFFCSQKSGRPLCIVKEHGLQLLRIYSTIHLTTSLLRYGYLADAGKRALHAQNRLPHRILIVKRLSRHKRSDPVVWS